MKKICTLLLTGCMLCSLAIPAAAEKSNTQEAVYLGVFDFANSHGDQKDSFTYRFSIDGEEKVYSVSNADGYAIQNNLQEGYLYQITVAGSTITKATSLSGDVYGRITEATGKMICVDDEEYSLTHSTKSYQITAAAGGAAVTKNPVLQVGDTVRLFLDHDDADRDDDDDDDDDDDKVLRLYQTFIAQDYTAPVSGIPGEKTLKNFLATSMQPVGTALYIYGGAWDWQDEGSSNQATTIGLSQSWIDFFQSQNQDYTYKNEADPAHSYYWRHYNEYYYAGVDCSGYVGWALYNLTNKQSGGTGFVEGATGMAKHCAQRDWGTWSQTFTTPNDHWTSDFHVGDIFSMNGHVWICLGTCHDGSIVILHSTPSDSKSGQPGGGIQLSALNPKNTGENCEAYQLVAQYMEAYYPNWTERYDAVLKDYWSYTSFTGAKAGKFSWDLSGSKLLSDPEGYADKTPKEILTDLLGYTVTFESNGGSSVAVQGVAFGKEIEEPEDPTRTGYEFEGWYTDAAVTHEYEFSSPVESNFTLYAKWVQED